MQEQAKSNVKALQALEAAFRAYAREEGRGPFELKTQPMAAYDEAATLAQAAIYAAELRAGEAERLANNAEENAKKSRECLTWIREAGMRALSRSEKGFQS